MFILFDIGGTKTRIAASKDCKEFGEPKIVKTPKDFDEGMRVFKDVAQELCQGEKIVAAGGGIRGLVDRDKKQLLNDQKQYDIYKNNCKERKHEIDYKVLREPIRKTMHEVTQRH